MVRLCALFPLLNASKRMVCRLVFERRIKSLPLDGVFVHLIALIANNTFMKQTRARMIISENRIHSDTFIPKNQKSNTTHRMMGAHFERECAKCAEGNALFIRGRFKHRHLVLLFL